MNLTESDIIVFESYKIFMEGLANYLGSGYEMVLHSLEDLDHSVIKIINGYHSGQEEGSPITDFSLSLVDKMKADKSKSGYYAYFSKNAQGELMKSTAILIYGESNRVIGLLCISFYMNTPYIDILNQVNPNSSSIFETESFADNPKYIIKQAIASTRALVESDEHIMPSLKKKAIIAQLYNQNIFKIKDAVETVARELGISKNTVYFHLKNITKEAQSEDP